MRSNRKIGRALARMTPGTAASLVATLVAVVACAQASAQQVSDPDFKPAVGKPAWSEGAGPVVLLDEAHFNFHTASGRYEPFAKLLRQDGYRVVPSAAKFSAESLKEGKILVISNALSEEASRNWSAPPASAFTDEEIATVREWVRQGGSLFLIADHMPMGAAAEKLGAAFGVKWNNGYAMRPASPGPIIFRRADGSLANHPITNGRNPAETVDNIATFTGSAFQPPQDAEVLLTFKSETSSLMPKDPGQFQPDTPKTDVTNWKQGAVLRYGKGRVAFFGEAAMFTAQVVGPQKQRFGMNSPEGAQNAQFLLNTVHWLSGLLDQPP
jgi:hypothetical protein